MPTIKPSAVRSLVTVCPVRSNGTKLTAAFPGAPVLPLEPKHGTLFNVVSLPGTTIEFKKDESGACTQLIFGATDVSYLIKRK